MGLLLQKHLLDFLLEHVIRDLCLLSVSTYSESPSFPALSKLLQFAFIWTQFLLFLRLLVVRKNFSYSKHAQYLLLVCRNMLELGSSRKKS